MREVAQMDYVAYLCAKCTAIFDLFVGDGVVGIHRKATRKNNIGGVVIGILPLAIQALAILNLSLAVTILCRALFRF